MLLIFAVALPFLLWLLFRLTLDAGPYEMDAGGKEGRFYPLMILYSVFFYVIAGLGIFGACSAWNLGMFVPASVFAVSASDALLFNGLIVFFYESYFAGKAESLGLKSNYTRPRYALVISLGFSAVSMLAVAWVLMVAGMHR